MRTLMRTAGLSVAAQRGRGWCAGLLLTLAAAGAAADEALTAEAEDVAEALGRLDQGYVLRGLRTGHGTAAVQGSSFRDAPDTAAGNHRPAVPKGDGMLEGVPVLTPQDDAPAR